MVPVYSNPHYKRSWKKRPLLKVMFFSILMTLVAKFSVSI